MPCAAIVGESHDVTASFAEAANPTCYETQQRSFEQPLSQGPAYHFARCLQTRDVGADGNMFLERKASTQRDAVLRQSSGVTQRKRLTIMQRKCSKGLSVTRQDAPASTRRSSRRKYESKIEADGRPVRDR